MAEREYVFPAPERFIVGTVGLPGDRSFYFQAKDADRVVTVAVEKEQVELLGERINELLDMVRSRSADGYMIPAGPDPADADNANLEMPVDPEFRVGTMSLGWDTRRRHLEIECSAINLGQDSEDSESPVLRVILSAEAAREFARRADQVVNAGRADCPFCSLPLDPDGHLCPRANGVAR